MASVGVRELKEQTSQILRRVREGRETIEVTYHGKVVARLVPVEELAVDRSAEFAAVWAEMDRLAAEIGARWPAGVSAADAVSGGRREL
ncbi:MAG: hypothetical protein AVDCRST_MAG88-1332 [uncultured Thermomicrobiales bacterium]|uniref:Antitoxin n=1 Tax=uncultured Thermomicrobiales bacterium TaxID=1645740 RepID=A0A6J4UUL7_9BACT|nr:MAG: hypothetical protein AVDCRST_MAG88-1332 [uncultured Thermomicrobiales bacterium]